MYIHTMESYTMVYYSMLNYYYTTVCHTKVYYGLQCATFGYTVVYYTTLWCIKTTVG